MQQHDQRLLVTLQRQLVFVAALFCGLVAQAEEVAWLYQVEVPVSSQNAAARSDAAGLALTEVLQRTSGQAVLPDSTRLRVAVSQPDRFYEQFRYVRDQRTGDLQLRVDFSAAAIARLSRDLELPVWWNNRPRLLLWALTPNGEVVSHTDEAANSQELGEELGFAQALLQRARQRGIPLVLPVADETGEVDVSAIAVRQGDLTSLAAYSASYAPEVVVAGRVRGSEGNLAARFVLELEGSSRNITARAASMSQLGALVADNLTNLLAERFAVVGQAGEITIAISGISNPRAYADLLRYLNSLAFVDSAQLREIVGGELRLALVTGASRSKLLQLLAVDGLLAPQDPAISLLQQRSSGQPSSTTTPMASSAIGLVWLGASSS